MQCVVYPMRRYGELLEKEEMRKLAVRGRLRIWNCHGINAQVYNEYDRAQLETLNDVRILSLDVRGILLTGSVLTMKGRSGEVQVIEGKQSWWCVPTSQHEPHAR